MPIESSARSASGDSTSRKRVSLTNSSNSLITACCSSIGVVLHASTDSRTSRNDLAGNRCEFSACLRRPNNKNKRPRC